MTQLPRQVRRVINRKARQLAQAAELEIRAHLTAQAKTGPAAGLRALTDADVAAMAWPKAELLAWLKEHAWG